MNNLIVSKMIASLLVFYCLLVSSPCLAFTNSQSQVSNTKSQLSLSATDDEVAPPSRARLLPNVLRYRGSVDQGYGRGGKKLGVPTANLPSSLFQNALEDLTVGVYFGWAALERDESDQNYPVYKAVVNVGYSPTFEGEENKEKIIEAHLIVEQNEKATSADDDGEGKSTIEDFYGIPMRLQLIGFLREEKKFDSFPELIAQINADVEDAKLSLDCQPYKSYSTDPFFVKSAWIGDGGGDEVASWEVAPI